MVNWEVFNSISVPVIRGSRVSENSVVSNRVADTGAAVNLALKEFSDLVRLAYLGATETTPWQSFFIEIGRIMNANWVSLALRPPTIDCSGLVLVWEKGHPVRIATIYDQYAYAIDPFLNLPIDRVMSIDEVIDDAELKRGEFYKLILEPGNVGQMLGVDFRSTGQADARLHTSESIDCHFRLCRPADGARFSAEDRALLNMLLPHLKLAVHLHAQGDVMETERALYAGAVDRMLVGMVILDETGAIMKTSALASEILKENDGISLVRGVLKANYQQEDRKLQRLMREALASATKWKPAIAEAVAVTRPSGRPKLGIIVRTIPLNAWSEGKHRPTVAVMIRDPERKSEASQEIMRNLFDLTPAEASLALLLANGLTLEEASEELNIRKNTARAHLRSIFSKTGVTRQTMLVRLILGSVSMG